MTEELYIFIVYYMNPQKVGFFPSFRNSLLVYDSNSFT